MREQITQEKIEQTAPNAHHGDSTHVEFPGFVDLKKNVLITDKLSTSPTFESTFDIEPSGTVGFEAGQGGWANMFRITEGDKVHQEWKHGPGCRIPSIFFQPSSTRLHVNMDRPGKKFGACEVKKALPLNQKTHVMIELNADTLKVCYDDKLVCSK